MIPFYCNLISVRVLSFIVTIPKLVFHLISTTSPVATVTIACNEKASVLLILVTTVLDELGTKIPFLNTLKLKIVKAVIHVYLLNFIIYHFMNLI